MTEAEWLACPDPLVMLHFLGSKASDRKMRLFVCACVARIRPLLTSPLGEVALEVSERLRDADTRAAGRAAAGALERKIEDFIMSIGQNAAEAFAWNVARQMDPDYTYPEKADKAWGKTLAAERSLQCRLLRCIIGNPVRLVTLDLAWLTWHDGLLVSMARQMYDIWDFSDMPVLADALEEAGCTDTNILGHCRSEGEHVRGCWVVDLLLGKE